MARRKVGVKAAIPAGKVKHEGSSDPDLARPCQPHGITVSARQAAGRPCEGPSRDRRRPDGKATRPDAGASAGEEALGLGRASGRGRRGPRHRAPSALSGTSEDDGPPEFSPAEESDHAPVRVGSAV